LKYFNLNCHEIYFSVSLASKIETKLSDIDPCIFVSHWWFGNCAPATRQLRQIPEWSCRSEIRTHSYSGPYRDPTEIIEILPEWLRESDRMLRCGEPKFTLLLFVGLAGVRKLPYPVYIDLEYPIYSTTAGSIFSTRSSRPLFDSSSGSRYPTAESFDLSISRGEAAIGIPKWRGGMTRRTRGKTLPDRWSGNAFTWTVERPILTQVIS